MYILLSFILAPQIIKSIERLLNSSPPPSEANSIYEASWLEWKLICMSKQPENFYMEYQFQCRDYSLEADVVEVVNQFKNAQQPHKTIVCMQLCRENWLELCYCEQFVAGICWNFCRTRTAKKEPPISTISE